ncbi:MAG: hypothetical protein VX836_04145 [Pseudomonadota bacterium]|nr:hypothetical protein [Pseudomonadota bacterium]
MASASSSQTVQFSLHADDTQVVEDGTLQQATLKAASMRSQTRTLFIGIISSFESDQAGLQGTDQLELTSYLYVFKRKTMQYQSHPIEAGISHSQNASQFENHIACGFLSF